MTPHFSLPDGPNWMSFIVGFFVKLRRGFRQKFKIYLEICGQSDGSHSAESNVFLTLSVNSVNSVKKICLRVDLSAKE
jgi:hypothetical protein